MSNELVKHEKEIIRVILEKHKKEILSFVFNAQQGDKLELSEGNITSIITKDFTLQDLGFTQISPSRFMDDEGRVFTKAFLEELIWDAISTHPEAWIS